MVFYPCDLAFVRLATILVVSVVLVTPAAERTRRIEYQDLPSSIRGALGAHGIDRSQFTDYLRHIDAETLQRLQEGERDHLIYYALQSQRFSRSPRIEPALSARDFVARLTESEKSRLLADASYLPTAGLPGRERTRIGELLHAIESSKQDPWLMSFRDLVRDGGGKLSADAFYPDYVRVARFLYRKEFVAAEDPTSAAATAHLYERRPHSSDTRVEAGFAVFVGLASLRALDSALRLPRALIVGPGLDFAPRTDLVDAVAPQSYQPFAVADALLQLSLASIGDLRVYSIDINLRVVHWIENLPTEGLTLDLLTGIGADRGSQLQEDYLTYVNGLGRSVGGAAPAPRILASDPHYLRSIAVRPDIVSALRAARVNVLTERIEDPAGFDVIIATNVLAYFNDLQLDLALTNLAAMLRPGGYLLHNESREELPRKAAAIGLPALYMRTVLIGGPSQRPLYDSIWIHQRSANPASTR